MPQIYSSKLIYKTLNHIAITSTYVVYKCYKECYILR